MTSPKYKTNIFLLANVKRNQVESEDLHLWLRTVCVLLQRIMGRDDLDHTPYAPHHLAHSQTLHILWLTPDFSSKILIPPKDTVRKTFCLCSPLDRAEAAIPCRRENENSNMRKWGKKIKQKKLLLLTAVCWEYQWLCKATECLSLCLNTFGWEVLEIGLKSLYSVFAFTLLHKAKDVFFVQYILESSYSLQGQGSISTASCYG